jgi:predicted nucleotidyltransferase component of viral defense system
MIPITELTDHARTKGVPLSTIERDYAQNWFLKILYSLDKRMILKGGTGIKKIYIDGYRFSDDLDFTLTEERDMAFLKDLFINTIVKIKEECGINFEENIRLEEVNNGYVGTVYFRITRETGSPIKIKLDITNNENEKIILEPFERDLIHNYSDNVDSKIIIYQLEEIFAEKLRTIFERIRPRDIYDIANIWDKVDKSSIPELFKEKCEFKQINPDLDSIIIRKEEFKNAWDNSLHNQLKNVPDFDEIFNKVIKIIKEIL